MCARGKCVRQLPRSSGVTHQMFVPAMTGGGEGVITKLVAEARPSGVEQQVEST